MSLFRKKPATKFDVLFAITAAIGAIWKANDTIKEYKAAQEAEKENQ